MATIVAVDDHPDDLRLLSLLLQVEGHEVVTAASAAEGLKAVEQHHPDLVVSDLVMPGIDGFELLTRLREDGAGPAPKTIFWTAYYSEADAAALVRRLELDGMVIKPIDPVSFPRLIDAALRSEPHHAPAPDTELLAELNAVIYDRLEALEESNRRLEESRASERRSVARAEQQALVVALGARALRGAGLHDLRSKAVESVASALDLERARVLQLSEDGLRLRPCASIGWSHDGGYDVIPRGSLAERALATREVVVLAEPITGAEEPAVADGAQSGAAVLIGAPDAPRGLLTVFSNERRSFTGDELLFLQAVANVLGDAEERFVLAAHLGDKVTQLEQSDRHRRLLIGHLLRAQEDERRRIAADIHDDTAQVLTALVLRLSMLQSQVLDPAVAASLAEATETARDSIMRLRHLMFDLQPPELDRDGLPLALEACLAAFADRTGIRAELRADPASDVGAVGRTVAYRIVQEALTNVGKHAAATRVRIELSPLHDGLLTSIVDDGRGFDAAGLVEAPGHLGVATMRERAETAGGWWRIESSPGAGTRVEFFVPSDGPGS